MFYFLFRCSPGKNGKTEGWDEESYQIPKPPCDHYEQSEPDNNSKPDKEPEPNVESEKQPGQVKPSGPNPTNSNQSEAKKPKQAEDPNKPSR